MPIPSVANWLYGISLRWQEKSLSWCKKNPWPFLASVEISHILVLINNRSYSSSLLMACFDLLLSLLLTLRYEDFHFGTL